MTTTPLRLAGTRVGDPVRSAVGFAVRSMGIDTVRASAGLHLGDGGLPERSTDGSGRP